MRKLFFIILGFTFHYSLSQNSSTIKPQTQQKKKEPKEIYELNATHIPLFLGSSLIYSYGNNLVRKQTPLQEQDLGILNRNAVYSFDRFATYLWSPTFSKVSDATVLLSFCSTPLLFLSKKIRKEWFTIGFMMVEASVLCYGITQTTKGLSDRLRPYVYNTNVPKEIKLEADAKNSFFSGHTALTAAYSFLSYKIYSDFFPKSDLKPYLLAGAIGLPFITATARVLAGKHYLSDVVAGYLIGATIGYGLPFLHKKKSKPHSVSSNIQILILPYF